MGITSRDIQGTEIKKWSRPSKKCTYASSEVTTAQPQPVVVVREDRLRAATSSGSSRKAGNPDFLIKCPIFVDLASLSFSYFVYEREDLSEVHRIVVKVERRRDFR